MATPTNVGNKTIFISYRRRVSSFAARSIFNDLRQNGYDVFMDVESIDSGRFDTIIRNQIEARAHFLIVLGPGSMEGFDDPNDWLRQEIKHAISLKRNVVPILTDGLSFEQIKPHLTGPLKQLSRYNALPLPHDYFEAGMVKLRDRFLKQPVEGPIRTTPQRDVSTVKRRLDKTLEEIARDHQRERPKRDTGEKAVVVQNTSQATTDSETSRQARLVSATVEWKRTTEPDWTPRRWVVYVDNDSDAPITVEQVKVNSSSMELSIDDWGTVRPKVSSDYGA